MTLTLLAAAVTIAAAMLGGAASVGAATKGGGGCPPISATHALSIFGLSHSLQERNYNNASGDSVRYECNGVAWSGPTPTTFQASLQTAKSGHGAAFGIDTWLPNPASPDAGHWPKDFEKLVATWVQGHVVWPGAFNAAGWPSKGLSPPPLGYAGAGILIKPQGPAKGLTAAAGCWWDRDTHSAVCLFVEEASFRPVVKHLYAFAKIAVPQVLG